MKLIKTLKQFCRDGSTRVEWAVPIDRFHCHAIKKQIGNRPIEEAKKMKSY